MYSDYLLFFVKLSESDLNTRFARKNSQSMLDHHECLYSVVCQLNVVSSASLPYLSNENYIY
jgi:hypothetical protein